MALVREKIVKQDLNLGHGTATVTTDSGGSQTGDKIGSHTLFQSKYNVRDFGAAGDGQADDTAAITAALDQADGADVYFPVGIYKITSPLSDTTSSHINITGEFPAFIGSTIVTVDASYDDLPTLGNLGKRYSIILCSGCNLIGEPDDASMNASNKLRSMRNLVAWGTASAKVGVYRKGGDTTIEHSSFVLFSDFGFLTKGGSFITLRSVATHDCGWNIANTGSVAASNTYYSGCGFMFVSNLTADDYTTHDPAARPTTVTIDKTWSYVRTDTVNNKSGFRGVQAKGLVSADIKGLGGYSGNFFHLCTGGNSTGYHIENYQDHGLTSSDSTPYGVYLYDSTIHWANGYNANLGTTTVDPWKVETSGTQSRPWQSVIERTGTPDFIGPVKSRLSQQITIATAGGTDNYDFSLVADYSSSPAIIEKGFFGDIYVTIMRPADFTKYSYDHFHGGTHRAGASSGWQAPSTARIGSAMTTLSGGFAATIAVSFQSGALRVAITWGASWSGGEAFELNVGLVGTTIRST